MFGERRELDVPAGAGGHGGADPLMLEQLFSPNPPPDAHHRAASHVDGAASVLVGIAGNLAMDKGLPIVIDDLFPLSSKLRGSRLRGRV
jgi:hypothetical protein